MANSSVHKSLYIYIYIYHMRNIISDHHVTFFQSRLVIDHCSICYSFHTQTAKHAIVLHPCLPVINPCDILQKSRLANKDKISAETWKLMLLESNWTWFEDLKMVTAKKRLDEILGLHEVHGTNHVEKG